MTRIEPTDIYTLPQLEMAKWWTENGYTEKVYKRYKTKKVFTVTKGGITMKFEILNTETDPAKVIAAFQKLFEEHSMPGRA